MSSLDKKRCAKCSMVVLEVFTKIMQDLMRHTKVKAKDLYNSIEKNAPFRRRLNKSELIMVDTLLTNEYTEIDVSLSYKIIVNFFQLHIPPPSRQWGTNPIDTEIGIGEDIERIRRERNSFVHKVNANISDSFFHNFFDTFIEVGKRIDKFLQKSPSDGYAHIVKQYQTCVLDPEYENKLLVARADIEQLEENYRFALENPRKEIHVFEGKSTKAAIEKIRADEAHNPKESYTKLKIVIHDVDDNEEVVTLINSLKENLNSENINLIRAEKGSIIVFIDVKNIIVLDDDLFKSEVSTFIQNLFKLCNLTSYIKTHASAVIASAEEEFEESTITLPDKATGKCLIGDNGRVIVNIEVKNNVFHSPDSLNITLNGFFKTLVMKGKGRNMLGNTDIYAELVQSENFCYTEEAFVQAQIPVKYNLPVSVELRQEFSIKAYRNKPPKINSCIKIGNKLVFIDFINNRINICNVDGIEIHNICLPRYQPLFLTEVNSNTVAVSCTDQKTILIINISTASVTIEKIETAGFCRGITYDDDNLYVVIDESRIQVMDLTGKLIRTIPLRSSRISDITVDRKRLVCIDDRSIDYCSLEGELIQKFENAKYQDLCRVSTDNEGNAYVTNRKTNTVVVASDDGCHYRELLTDSDGLNTPHGIYFDKKENTLLVCNKNDGKAFLFDVKGN